MTIRDEDDNLLVANEIGEICLRGPQVMAGYWRNQEETAKALRGGWLRTGDLGRTDENGFLQVVDRKKNMLISGGVNIYPAEVERAMASLLPNREFATFGVPDSKWGERLVALIEGADTTDLEALKRDCRDLLGDYKAPREIWLTSEPLPRTATGKISRRDLLSTYNTLMLTQISSDA
jgi:fatty-acyl-CoA synthase